MLKQITAAEMQKLSHDDSWGKILNIARTLSATHIVLFQNNDFTSSRFGESTLMVVGPYNTYKSPAECEGRHLNDLPSQRQYAQCYCEVPNEA